VLHRPVEPARVCGKLPLGQVAGLNLPKSPFSRNSGPALMTPSAFADTYPAFLAEGILDERVGLVGNNLNRPLAKIAICC
jgi:hypothetical protein